jgi:hypothetical protein
MSAPCETTISAIRSLASVGYLSTCRTKRSDTLIASVVLLLLLAGWVMNFVGPKELSEGVGNIIAYSFPRQA